MLLHTASSATKRFSNHNGSSNGAERALGLQAMQALAVLQTWQMLHAPVRHPGKHTLLNYDAPCKHITRGAWQFGSFEVKCR